jgi:predicted DNA-binding protein
MSFSVTKYNKEMIDTLCKITDVPKSRYINAALEEYLEDQLDLLRAVEVMANTRKEDITEFKYEDYV